MGLAVTRARATGADLVFWLDERRAHDAQIIAKVRDVPRRPRHLGPARSRSSRRARRAKYSLERIRKGEDTISVTGNVLRDYLTDLFPIMELGTSAKMLSIVPLMNGGGLFETGAGGSAPKHVQQFVKENHLRWDSLGEFLALGGVARAPRRGDRQLHRAGCSPTRSTARPAPCSTSASRRRARCTSSTTAAATSTWPCTGRRSWPRRPTTPQLAAEFAPVAEALTANEEAIVAELNEVQGSPSTSAATTTPSEDLVVAAMRPSTTFNSIIDAI